MMTKETTKDILEHTMSAQLVTKARTAAPFSTERADGFFYSASETAFPIRIRVVRFGHRPLPMVQDFPAGCKWGFGKEGGERGN